MEEYKCAHREYILALKMTEGGGETYQGYIDDAHDKLTECYNKLTNEEKNCVGPLPTKVENSYDGCGGSAVGIASMAGNGNCKMM